MYRTSKTFLFWRKAHHPQKDRQGLRTIAIGNTLRRIPGSKDHSERQNFFENVQVGCGTKRGAEITAHSFQNLNECDNNPKWSVLLNLDFKNA